MKLFVIVLTLHNYQELWEVRTGLCARMWKCVSLTQKPGSHQRRVPRTEGGNASIVVPSLWSKNLEKLELVCVHGYENAFLWHKSQGHIKEGYLLEFRKLWYLDSKLDSNWENFWYLDSNIDSNWEKSRFLDRFCSNFHFPLSNRGSLSDEPVRKNCTKIVRFQCIGPNSDYFRILDP